MKHLFLLIAILIFSQLSLAKSREQARMAKDACLAENGNAARACGVSVQPLAVTDVKPIIYKNCRNGKSYHISLRNWPASDGNLYGAHWECAHREIDLKSQNHDVRHQRYYPDNRVVCQETYYDFKEHKETVRTLIGCGSGEQLSETVARHRDSGAYKINDHRKNEAAVQPITYRQRANFARGQNTAH